MRKPLMIAAALVAGLFVAGRAAAQERAFTSSGATVSLAATGTTARVQLQTSVTASNLRVYNSGAVAVFVACGDVTVTATAAASLPVAPGTVEIIGCGQQYVAGISAGTAATVYLTPGNGL